MEKNYMKVVNYNASDENSDVEMEHQHGTEKDNECKEERCDTKDKPWEINEDTFDKDNTNIITSTELENLNYGSNLFLSSENNDFLSNADVMQSQQFISDTSFEDVIETETMPELNDYFNNELETENNFQLVFKQTENDLSCDGTNIILPSFSESLCPNSLPYAHNSNSLSSPSNISHFSCLPGTSNEHSKYSSTKNEDLLFSYFEKISNDNLKPISESNEIIETKEDVESFETLSLAKCNQINNTLEKKKGIEYDLFQYVSENVRFEDKCSVQTNSECFVEDKIIINSDIMYNIELKLHLTKMQHLADQVSKTPDLTLLNKCMKLMPISEIQHKRQIITEECRPFSNDISESNYYNIQHKDWNKILVSQAAVLSHVGFDFTSIDILYIIRDEAINYTKKLAGIMKKNFDIQSKSSVPSIIDPIHISLQEMGLKDGALELIKHYKNDVFDRRQRLLKECEHFQSTIDQFVKSTLLTPSITNQYETQEFFVGNESMSEINVIEKNIFREEKASTSTEVKCSESDHIDIAPVKSEYIKTNTVDTYNRIMYNTKCSKADIQFNDLLKCSHMITEPSNSRSNSLTSKKSFLSTNNLCKPQNEKSINLLKSEKLFDLLNTDNIVDESKNKINSDKVNTQSTSNSVKSIGLDHASFQTIVDEFNENFNRESVYDNFSPFQDIPVNNSPDINNVINEENFSDHPN